MLASSNQPPQIPNSPEATNPGRSDGAIVRLLQGGCFGAEGCELAYRPEPGGIAVHLKIFDEEAAKSPDKVIEGIMYHLHEVKQNLARFPLAHFETLKSAYVHGERSEGSVQLKFLRHGDPEKGMTTLRDYYASVDLTATPLDALFRDPDPYSDHLFPLKTLEITNVTRAFREVTDAFPALEPFLARIVELSLPVLTQVMERTLTVDQSDFEFKQNLAFSDFAPSLAPHAARILEQHHLLGLWTLRNNPNVALAKSKS